MSNEECKNQIHTERITTMNLQPLTTITLCTLLAFTTAGFDSCEKKGTKTPEEIKKEILFWGQQVVGTGTDLIPILKSNGRDTQKAEQFLSLGQKVLTAIRDNDGSAIGYIEAAIDVMDEVVAETNLIKDTTKRNTALLILLVAKVALRNIAANLPPPVVTDEIGPARAAKIKAFARSKDWRCRAAGTLVDADQQNKEYKAGRYMPMYMCGRFPSNSVVETR